jgi:hypothetical protein
VITLPTALFLVAIVGAYMLGMATFLVLARAECPRGELSSPSKAIDVIRQYRGHS